MSIPGAPALLRPLLARHEDGQEHVRRNLRAELARDFGLTEEDQTKRLPGANQPIFHTNLTMRPFISRGLAFWKLLRLEQLGSHPAVVRSSMSTRR